MVMKKEENMEKIKKLMADVINYVLTDPKPPTPDELHNFLKGMGVTISVEGPQYPIRLWNSSKKEYEYK